MNDPQRLVGTYLLGLEPLLVSTVGWPESGMSTWRHGFVFNPDVQRTLILGDKGMATMEVRGPDGSLQASTSSLHKSGVDVEP